MKMSQRAMVLALCLATLGGVAQAADKPWWGTSGTAEPARTALVNQDPEAEAQPCGLDQKYNVIGFNRNSNELTRKLKLRLDQVAADIAAEAPALMAVEPRGPLSVAMLTKPVPMLLS